MDSFWDFFWFVLAFFLLMAYLMVLFQILTDMFRDRELSGWWKAVWVVCLIFAPFLTALIYLIARGRGMAERNVAAIQSAQASQAEYIRSVTAGAGSPADQIAQAKSLLDSGAISQEEYDSLKAKALG
ncbi:SHOCT domain-containing protein [Nocardioides sp.]|uniref:SHOCT domain-containing protein n=1 Tax=Nocardioides sp. TaxID=35761 RepID=UPI003785227C